MSRTTFLWVILCVWALVSPARAAWIDGGTTLTAETGETAIVACTNGTQNCMAEFVDETSATSIPAPTAGYTRIYSFSGQFYKRGPSDSVAPKILTSADADNKWDYIIDATGKTGQAFLDEYYAAIQPVVTAAGCTAMEALTPFRIKLKGKFDSGGDGKCNPGTTASDALDLEGAAATGRVCLAFFRSAPYASSRPVVHGGPYACTAVNTPYTGCTGLHTATADTAATGYCILPPGSIVIDKSELELDTDETGMSEPLIGFMVGSGFYSGFEDPSTGRYMGSILGIDIIGPGISKDLADVDTDGTDPDWTADKIATTAFSNTSDSSTTTVIENWLNGNPNVNWYGLANCDSNTNTDLDDWCFVTASSFSSHLKNLSAAGMNGALFGAGSNLSVNGVELSSNGGTVGWGLVHGDQLYSALPVSASCKSGACGAFVASSDLVLNDGVSEGYTVADFATTDQGSVTAQDLYTESASGQYGILIGAGRCVNDHSQCVIDSDCTASTCDRSGFNCQSNVTLQNVRGAVQMIALGPCAQDPYTPSPDDIRGFALRISGYAPLGQASPSQIKLSGISGTTTITTGPKDSDCTGALAPYNCCTGSALGTCSKPHIGIDLRGLDSGGVKVPWPSSYPGSFQPPLPEIYSTDCVSEINGIWRQRCTETDVSPHTFWLCNPANGGVSATLCDTAADWEQIGGGGGGGNSFTTIDVPTGTDPVADATTDTLTYTCSNGLTCVGSAVNDDSIGLGIASAGLLDVSLSGSYAGTGACASNQWASTLNRNAAPTCTQPGFSNLSGTIAQAQIPANLSVDRADCIDLDNNGTCELQVFTSATGALCTAGNEPCVCIMPDQSGGPPAVQRVCFNKNGEIIVQDNQAVAGGNQEILLPNDTALATNPTCKLTGSVGTLRRKDVNEASADRYGVCDGTVEIGTISDRKEVINKPATANVADPGTADGDEYEGNDTIITNRGAGAGNIVLTLPVAQIGQCMTFYHVDSGNLDINPNGTERILELTNADGDAIRSITIGDALMLCAISQAASSQWAVLFHHGAWTDVN